MSYVLPVSSFSTYLSPCFETVPEKVWVSAPVADPDGLALDPDSGVRELGAVVSGVCDESGVCEDGVCPLSGIDGDGVGDVCGVCCDGVVSGDDDGCCACLSGVEGVVSCAWSALPQEIIPIAIARVARNVRD